MTAPGSRARRTLFRGTDAVAERFITAVRSLDRILDEAKLFLAVRDELPVSLLLQPILRPL